jgi:hypothetical protein
MTNDEALFRKTSFLNKRQGMLSLPVSTRSFVYEKEGRA